MLSSTMRTFVALDLDAEIRGRILGFVEEVRGLASDARWLSPESLHVTLKFIGEKPDDIVKKIEDALASIRAEAFPLRFTAAGFFPTAKAARVFWIGINADDSLAKLAGTIDESLAGLGVPKEERAFSPHLT